MHLVDISPVPRNTIDISPTSPVAVVPGSVLVRAVHAVASARATAPVLTSNINATVNAVVARQTGLAKAPSVGGSDAIFVSPVVAVASGSARVPVVKGDALVTAVAAKATAAARVPFITTAILASATVNAVLASSTSRPQPPTASGEAVLTGGGPGLASALALVPVVTGTSGGGTVTFDSVGPGAASAASVTPLSWTHTATGTNRAVLVALAVGKTGVGTFSSWTRSCTYGGVAMTSLAVLNCPDGVNGFVEVFGLLNPPTGAQTVVASATFSGVDPNSLVANSISYSSVASFSAAVTGVANAVTPSLVVPSAAGRRVVAAFAAGSGISGPTQTQRYLNNFDLGSATGNLLIQDAAGAANVTFSAADNGDQWALIGVSLVAA